MTPKILKACIIAAWLASAAWLIRYEAYPEAFSHVFRGYSHVFSDGRYIVDSWLRILFEGNPIGYTHTWVDARPENRTAPYTVFNRTAINLNLMGLQQNVNMSCAVFLDPEYRLLRFSFFMASGLYSMRIDGNKTEGRTFAIAIRGAGGDTQRATITIPEEAVVYSPMTQAVVADLQPGSEFRMRTFDPVTLTVSDMAIRALRRETVEIAGEVRDAMLLSISFQGIETPTWIDKNGEILRQETPFGWVLETAAPEKIFESAEGTKPMTEDMLAALAVPCRGGIDEDAGMLRLRLNAPAGLWTPWSSERQRVLGREQDGVLLEMLAQWPPRAGRGEAPPGDVGQYLRPSIYIQSGDERIINQARAIVGEAGDAWSKAVALNKWVHANIKKSPAAAIPSALDVLRNREGDCTEHTYLFAALARAAGLPARIHVGLAYYDGAFYYHAWPAVFAGEWIEMDPTLGLNTVRASHITLLTGELSEQMKLGSLVGKLSVVVQEPSARAE